MNIPRMSPEQAWAELIGGVSPQQWSMESKGDPIDALREVVRDHPETRMMPQAYVEMAVDLVSEHYRAKVR